MKLSFMTFACPEWELSEILSVAAELGYDGVEPRIDANQRHGLEVTLDAEGRREARRRAADAGVELCCLATSLQFIKLGREERAELREEARERIELAAELGIPGMRVFGGPVPEGVGLVEAFQAAARNLRDAGEMAQEAGVELWVETHDSLSKAALCAQVVRAADHPAVSFNYDVMHPYRCGEPLGTTFEALGERIRHTHWHDCVAAPDTVEITRFGEGNLPLADILAGLRERRYDGYLSGEWFNEQLGATPRESLRHYAEATRELLAAG
ncbi:MAG: sugar phosphate isomerase/epimerase [Armatimonadetes bacterium]|nr:sugar phosphate isomerase/epimerase [Armatimonadota bacterium]